MIGSRGQQWTVLKLLQAGVLAVVMLTIVWGVVQSAKDQTPQADVYSVTCTVLSSAYVARGTGEHFTREALLLAQEFDSTALIHCSGIPGGVDLDLFCNKAFCLHDGESLDRSSDCRLHTPCDTMGFVAGETINICVSCDNDDECGIWFGESEC